jgi:UDP-4-amino-4,6-dideoxy-N-acetyl-beta-L-altrosamine transaminase|tara:strand:+ start:1244 stop:2398 length:1155 start_codon:yes stop_codon:yes gene_type:complete
MIIPYNRQHIDTSDIKLVNKVLKSNLITQGPNVGKFEKAIAKRVKSKYAVASNSATSSLHLACMAIGLKKGDWLWTSPNSFVASSNCGLLCGAKIDFIDINPRTYNLDVDRLEKKLVKAKKSKKLPKVVVPVHFAGLPCEMKKIFELSKKYKFKIIEDASHALGAKYNSEDIGNCKYSDIAVFSFHPIKMITTIEGGVATTNNQKYADQMSKLRTHGIVKEKFKMKRKKEGNWYYEQNDLGLNYRMNDVQAALGLSQLKKLNMFLKKRREIAKLYIKKFKKLPVNFQLENLKLKSSYHLFVIEIQKGKKLKKKIFDILRRNNILVNVHYIPIHLQPYYMKNFGFKKGQFKLAENYYDRAISLPIYYSLSNSRVQRIINLIKKYL